MRRTWLGVSGLALIVACSNDTGQPPSQAGDLLVAYVHAGPEAGALLLNISGGQVDNVTALGGQQMSFASPTVGNTKVVILGTLPTGNLLKLRVPDVTKFANYSVRLEQVADKITFALIDPSQHTFSVHR